MKIGSIGYNYVHGADFVMDRPNGPGCWLMVIAKTPAVFEINSVKCNVKPNSFVLFSANTPCKYHALGDVYTDDWFYAGYECGDEDMLSRLDIPINKAVYIGSAAELSQIMHIMSYEFYSADAFHNEINEKYLEIFFMKLSRIINSKNAKNLKSYVSSDAFIEKNYKLTQLRSKFYNMPENIPDISSMADEIGMSRSGFQHLYKRVFGVSVSTDIIEGRIARAKRLLTATKLSVEQIAERCGYSSSYHFMRQFKEKSGRTPTEFRLGTYGNTNK